MMPPLVIQGMHGLGDNLRQRAIVRQMMERSSAVWLESSWVSVYHDLIGRGLRVVGKPTALRTQTKNAQRERMLFNRGRPPLGARRMQIWYPPDLVRKEGSVLGAMMAAAGCDMAAADFRLPVPRAWHAAAELWLTRWQTEKPIMIYRPLVERTEWSGCASRNPDHITYARLFDSIRSRFFVVSVADLVPGVEWSVGASANADAVCHAGELNFETLAALTARASLVFCSPGFAGVLAQAVETPVVCVFGGYENSGLFFGGPHTEHTLGIDPVNPCACFSHTHNCQKAINVTHAQQRLATFADAAIRRTSKVAGRRNRLERA